VSNVNLQLGDCLELMKALPDKSVDMILCDLPYGTTACKWDSAIPLSSLWEAYSRVLSPVGVVVLTSSQPFTSALIMSNIGQFKYEIIWDKVNRTTGFLDAKKRPLKRHEVVCVFAPGPVTYNPQMESGTPYNAKRSNPKGHPEVYSEHKAVNGVNFGTRYPVSILPIKADVKTEMGRHPTQKPVALLEYLIKTYSNPDHTILDNTMGSGSTGVAAVNLGRNFIGMEKEPKYFEIAQARIAEALAKKEAV